MTDVTLAPAPKPLVLRTSIGKKVAMATSGIILVGFVIAHMVGNLKFFTGEHHFDQYAAFLRTMGDPIVPHYFLLWGLRAVLLGAVIVHIWAAYMTTVQSKKARPVPYAHKDSIQASYASRTMRWGGLTILLFVIFHLLQFTTGTIQVGGSFDSPYQRLVAAFQVWYVVLVYALAMLALGMHLRHGIWSAVQTLGWSTRAREVPIKRTALVVALVIVVGFLAPPVAILFGLVK